MTTRDLHAWHQSEPIFDRWKHELEDEKMRIEKIKPKPKTYHEGANDERTAILAKVRRERKKAEKENPWIMSGMRQFEAWLLQRNERYKKRNGGL